MAELTNALMIKVCEVLRLDPNTVADMSIHLRPNEILRVDIDLYADEEHMPGFHDAVTRLVQEAPKVVSIERVDF